MLRGRFGTTSGRPYIDGSLLLSRLDLSLEISFLVDTGADESFLMPSDAQGLLLDYRRLSGRSTGGHGAGGSFTAYREPALITFSDGERLFGYSVIIGILEPRDDMLGVPSLIGRDILHRWRMTYEHSSGILVFDVESADVIVEAQGPFPEPAIRPQ